MFADKTPYGSTNIGEAAHFAQIVQLNNRNQAGVIPYQKDEIENTYELHERQPQELVSDLFTHVTLGECQDHVLSKYLVTRIASLLRPGELLCSHDT